MRVKEKYKRVTVGGKNRSGLQNSLLKIFQRKGAKSRRIIFQFSLLIKHFNECHCDWLTFALMHLPLL